MATIMVVCTNVITLNTRAIVRRHTKRFKKGGSAHKDKEGKKDGKGRFSNKNGADSTANEPPTREVKPSEKPLKATEDIQTARLTGAMVKPTGAKVTFDDDDDN